MTTEDDTITQVAKVFTTITSKLSSLLFNEDLEKDRLGIIPRLNRIEDALELNELPQEERPFNIQNILRLHQEQLDQIEKRLANLDDRTGETAWNLRQQLVGEQPQEL